MAVFLCSLSAVFLLPPVYTADFTIGYLGVSSTDPAIQLAKNITLEIKQPEIEVKGIYKEFNNSFDDVLSAFEFVTHANITAIIGPFQELYAVISESLGIPYLATTWVPENVQRAPLVQIYPDAETFEAAVADVVRYYQWPRVVVIYDSKEGRDIIERLLYRRTIVVKGYNVGTSSIRQDGNMLKETLSEMRDNNNWEIVLACRPATAHEVLTQALYLGLLSTRNKWIIVNMGTEETDLSDFVDSNANITVLSLNHDEEHNSTYCGIGFAPAVLHDAIHVFAAMAKNYQTGPAANGIPAKGVLFKTLRDTVKVDGCSGLLEMTPLGSRANQFLQLYTLDGLRHGSSRGIWTSGARTIDMRIDFNRTYRDLTRDIDTAFGIKTLTVTTKIEPPFVQWKKGHGNSSKDTTDDLEGYCIDILRELASRYHFEYNLYLVPDGKFGSLKPAPRGWTGMIRELIDKRADIAMAPFSITPSRSGVADFTKPFMIKGTSTIVKNPERHISVFQFLAPLSKVVWVGIFISFLGASLVLFGISRINSDRKPNLLDNLRESFWYIWAALLRGGTSDVPKATSSRTLSSAWWFFSLIVISIYTANLAAFLTLTNVNLPINSAEDLANQKVYDYGTVSGSQIEYFFEHTTIDAYEKMYAHMHTLSPESQVRRVENGLERVRKEKYAFLWDSPTLRYMIQSECDLLEIGVPFDLKGYGWAVQKNAPFQDTLSWGMLKLDDEGKLKKFEKKWWGRTGCPDMTQRASTEALQLINVAGIFLVLLGGVLLAAVLCAFNYLMYKRQENVKKRKKTSEETTWPLRQDKHDRPSQWYPGPNGGLHPLQHSNQVT